jgi:putative ABC transport system permease protein
MFLRTVGDSIVSAIHELWTNKLRALLSLSGITIGIFCVVAVLAAVDSMERNIKQSIEKFGSNVVYVDKWPWTFTDDYPWWKYMNRPRLTYNEMQQLESRVESAQAFAITASTGGKNITYQGNTVEDMAVLGCTNNYAELLHLDFTSGRFFNQQEDEAALPVTILGHDIASNLFPNPDEALGKEVTLMGTRVRVIGVVAKQGESLVNSSFDEIAVVPYNFFGKHVNIDGMEINPQLLVEAKAGVSLDQLSDELRGAMRSIRRQHPRQEDNFALNRISMLTSFITQIFGALDIAAFIIGGFALLVGGFGIANIMFVSVRERTNLIGIKKAIGAKNVLILIEFLVEAVILSVFGGLFGLLLVYLCALAASSAAGFELTLSTSNIVTGLVISSVIGILAGLWPAYSASRLHPVDAIRFK